MSILPVIADQISDVPTDGYEKINLANRRPPRILGAMVIGLGLDIVEIARIRGVMARHGERFIRRVFTPAEQGIAASRPRGREQFFAGRWAAKEAVAKALGCGFGTECGWTDIEIVNGAAGKPEASLYGRAEETARRLGIERLLVSISHETHYATAMALAETRTDSSTAAT